MGIWLAGRPYDFEHVTEPRLPPCQYIALNILAGSNNLLTCVRSVISLLRPNGRPFARRCELWGVYIITPF